VKLQIETIAIPSEKEQSIDPQARTKKKPSDLLTAQKRAEKRNKPNKKNVV
jgi:hypothetical protein